MEFTEYITLEHLICLAGLIIFVRWLIKTSLGRKALAESVPRRNNMPFYMPFAPLFIFFLVAALITSITNQLLGNLQGWKSEFLENLILCTGELAAIIAIIFLVKIYFVRGLKGFGLNVKTIIKDIPSGFVNLLTIWPIMIFAMLLTMQIAKFFLGEEYEIQQHQQLKLLTEYSQLPLKVIIFIFAAVIVSIFEEMLFRGLFQTTIRSFIEARFWLEVPQKTTYKNSVIDRYGAWFAILISSGLFATSHANVDHWLALFVLGVCLGYAYEKSGSLFRPIFIHSLFNAISVVLVLNQ
jgi:membrane protease YdiL (CAAX protease family)